LRRLLGNRSLLGEADLTWLKYRSDRYKLWQGEIALKVSALL
jgi:hypothetical protein